MMSQHDIQFMEQSVRDIISEWNNTITILTPLPEDQQTNMNKYLREGKLIYNSKQVSAERKDIVNNYDDNIKVTSGGIKDEGIVLFAIPDIIDSIQYKPSDESLFIIDTTNELYRLKSARDRIGETLITLSKMVGGTTINDIIIQ